MLKTIQSRTLYDDTSHHDGDKFAALEDDLGRVVEVAHRGVGQPHGGHRQEGKQ